MNCELKRALRPVKRRIRRNRFLRGAAAGLAAGLAAAVLLQAAACFVPVPDRGLWAAAAAAAAALLAAVGNAARPVKNRTAAEAADACGLKERAVTALEGPEDEPIRQLQRRDACKALAGLDMKKIRPGSVKKALLAALGCAVALGVLLLVPNPQDGAAAARKALNRTLREGQEKIARAAEEDEERLPEDKKSELRKITADLNRELGESRDAADALVALDRAEQRLEQLRQQTAGDAADAADGMAGDSGTGKDGKDGADGQAGEIAGRAADAQAGAEGATGSSAGQMKTMEALSALKGLVNPSLQAGANAPETNGQQGTMAGANGPGTNGNNSQGSNGASGSSPNGKAGAGAGEGSTNEEQQGGSSSNGTITKGSRDPKYKEEAYETIYDPERIGRNSRDVMTEQNRTGDEGSAQIETGPGRGDASGDVPWGEALQEYAETEARAADRENLTVQERQWVDEYYRLLTEQK